MTERPNVSDIKALQGGGGDPLEAARRVDSNEPSALYPSRPAFRSAPLTGQTAVADAIGQRTPINSLEIDQAVIDLTINGHIEHLTINGEVQTLVVNGRVAHFTVR